MIRSTLTHRLVRTTAALLTVAGLLAGIGVQHAAADSPTAPVYRPLSTPVLLSVEATSATTILVRWQDNSSGESFYAIQSSIAPGYVVPPWGAIGTALPHEVPGQGGIATVTLRNLEPSTGYCVRVTPVIDTGPVDIYPYRYTSNVLCTITPAAPVLRVPTRPFIVPIGR